MFQRRALFAEAGERFEEADSPLRVGFRGPFERRLGLGREFGEARGEPRRCGLQDARDLSAPTSLVVRGQVRR